MISIDLVSEFLLNYTEINGHSMHASVSFTICHNPCIHLFKLASSDRNVKHKENP
jgi:hypothetical protein